MIHKVVTIHTIKTPINTTNGHFPTSRTNGSSSGSQNKTSFYKKIDLTNTHNKKLFAKIVEGSIPPKIKKLKFELLHEKSRSEVSFYTNLWPEYLSVAIVQQIFKQHGMHAFEREGILLLGQKTGETGVGELRRIHVQPFGFPPTISGREGEGGALTLTPFIMSTIWSDPLQIKVINNGEGRYSIPMNYSIKLGTKEMDVRFSISTLVSTTDIYARLRSAKSFIENVFENALENIELKSLIGQ